MKEKFLKMTGIFFLVAMMAVMLTSASAWAVTSLSGFSGAFVAAPGATNGTISATNNVTIVVDENNGSVGQFIVTDNNGTDPSVDIIVGDAQTTTLGSDTVAITHNATVGGTLGVTGTTTLTGLLTANGGAALNSLNTNNHVLVDDTSARLVGGGNSVAVTSAGGTTVTGALTSQGGNVDLATTTYGAMGDASLQLRNNSWANLVYFNSTDRSKVSGLMADDNRFLAGYEQTGGPSSDFTANINSISVSYNDTTGHKGGLLVTDGATTATTTVTGGSGTVLSTLTLDAASATLISADGSGVTINNGGNVSMLNSTANGAHGLIIYTDRTVLSGGGSTAESSSLTLADNAATLAVGTASTYEIQVLQATNNGSTTAVTIGGSSNRQNDILATAANGVNYITANTTNGSNIIAANTNTITGTTESSMSGGSTAHVDLIYNSARMFVDNGSTFTATNNQLTAQTADGSGLIVNNGVTAPGATAVSLLNSTGHGLTVNTDSTILSGGTSSTSLTLNNWGATFSTNGIPARVTGIADGKDDYDAVNYHQLQKAYSGIASVSALAAIPSTMPGKKFAIGAGYGYFEHESAVAVGLKASLFDSLSVTAGVGFGVGDGPSSSTASANAGFSYSF